MGSDTGSPFLECRQARAKGGTIASGEDTQIDAIDAIGVVDGGVDADADA